MVFIYIYNNNMKHHFIYRSNNKIKFLFTFYNNIIEAITDRNNSQKCSIAVDTGSSRDNGAMKPISN
jgi:hypothetical protein